MFPRPTNGSTNFFKSSEVIFLDLSSLTILSNISFEALAIPDDEPEPPVAFDNPVV